MLQHHTVTQQSLCIHVAMCFSFIYTCRPQVLEGRQVSGHCGHSNSTELKIENRSPVGEKVFVNEQFF